MTGPCGFNCGSIDPKIQIKVCVGVVCVDVVWTLPICVGIASALFPFGYIWIFATGTITLWN